MGITKNNLVFTKDTLKTGELFKEHSTFGVGGRIGYYYEPTSLTDLEKCIEFAINNKITYRIIGNGSNILCSDNGYNGLIVCTKKITKILYNSTSGIIRAFSGASLTRLITLAKELSLGGMEALCGIPATVGGATTMNAGAFGYHISDYITSVCYFDGTKRIVLETKDCNFDYRNSIFKNSNLVVLYADFKFDKKDKADIEKRINKYTLLRNESQPKGKSCGSVFKNPTGYTAGKIIESVALKGFSVGDAEISTKHANFIINNGNAKSSDIVLLIDIIKKKVKKIFNVDLQEEVEYLGFNNGFNG